MYGATTEAGVWQEECLWTPGWSSYRCTCARARVRMRVTSTFVYRMTHSHTHPTTYSHTRSLTTE